jgi:hypothetical protein
MDELKGWSNSGLFLYLDLYVMNTFAPLNS